MKAFDFVLGELLHTANSELKFFRKSEFYGLKDRLLRKYGTPDGFDVQHIEKICFQCEGKGKLQEEVFLYGRPWLATGATCPKCGGSGKYLEFWTHLLRYKIGRRDFHLPEHKYYEDPKLNLQRPMIEGYIDHIAPKYYLADEAFYWLCLFFDFKLFMQFFGRVGHVSTKFTPMVVLGTWLFEIKQLRHIPSNIRTRFNWWWIPFRQSRCRHDFSGDQFYCPKCNAINPNEIPF